MTDIVLSSGDLPRMDAYIVGSDQVWSICFTGGIDNLYWGQFDRNGAKLISYAGSAAENMGDSFILMRMLNYLSLSISLV